jgi:hypothetical protein
MPRDDFMDAAVRVRAELILGDGCCGSYASVWISRAALA